MSKPSHVRQVVEDGAHGPVPEDGVAHHRDGEVHDHHADERPVDHLWPVVRVRHRLLE